MGSKKRRPYGIYRKAYIFVATTYKDEVGSNYNGAKGLITPR